MHKFALIFTLQVLSFKHASSDTVGQESLSDGNCTQGSYCDDCFH